MNSCATQSFYNNLELSFEKAWSIIEPGAIKRTSPAHTPAVATLCPDGTPQQRVMVLRAANRANRQLRFHTDARAAKVAQHGAASVLMYDADEKVQLRLGGWATVQTEGPEVDAAWAGSTTFARRCYMAEHAPGSLATEPMSGLPEWIEGKQPEESQLTEFRPNFALLWVIIDSVEWLYLSNAGHRRARWRWDETGTAWSGNWLIP